MSKKEETIFKEKILPELRKLGYFVKIQQASIRGTPDLIGCINGVFIALELKTDIGKTSAIQDVNLAKILKNGGIALQVSPATYPAIFSLLVRIRRSTQVNKSRKYLLSLLQELAKGLDT